MGAGDIWRYSRAFVERLAEPTETAPNTDAPA